MRVGLIKTSLVNFPGRVAAAVFLPGCNLRCPFCHNGELARASVVTGPKTDHADGEDYVELDEVYAHLERRKNVLGGLAISGGEPLLSPATTELTRKARELGLAVKIDTNGTLPDLLSSLVSDASLRPDMIAIDVKTSLSRYGELAMEPSRGEAFGAALAQSISILRTASAAQGASGARPLRVEYRTVLVPGLVGEAEIRAIAAILPEDADWELARFVPGTCLDPSYDGVEPYGPVALGKLVDLAKSLRAGAALR
ncbi:MAG TPA: radical SAM protein [Treponemataceae bacterium]|nr:radical SAM protein [Treponemataceae bacterium]